MRASAGWVSNLPLTLMVIFILKLIEKIDALRINCVAPDVKMDEFLREKYNLLAAPTDIPTITRTQHDLETTYNALKNDKIVPEIIKIINKFNTTTNVLTQNEDRKKARSIETALISVPVINRHEIMNEAANTPEITAVQKALASHRSLFRKGSEFNPDHTINESTAAHSFKLIKAKYREQQKKHNDLIISSDSTIRNEETSSTRVGPGGKKQCYKTIY